MNQARATTPPTVPPIIAPRLGVREAAEGAADELAVAVVDDVDDIVDVDDIKLVVVVIVVVIVIKNVVAVDRLVVGVVSGTVSCDDPEGPIPTRRDVELLDIHSGHGICGRSSLDWRTWARGIVGQKVQIGS